MKIQEVDHITPEDSIDEIAEGSGEYQAKGDNVSCGSLAALLGRDDVHVEDYRHHQNGENDQGGVAAFPAGPQTEEGSPVLGPAQPEELSDHLDWRRVGAFQELLASQRLVPFLEGGA